MSQTFQRIQDLVSQNDIKVSEHGYDELSADGILIRDVVSSLHDAIVVEDYPDYPKGPCVLLLQRDQAGKPVHVVWGIPKDANSPAVVVTAYRPDQQQWSDDFRRRKP
jgi:hypothetical protein